jgi:aminomethyltransferase
LAPARAGNDLNEETTPLEASLKWTIGKRRRDKMDFIGGEAIKKQMEAGIKKRRVGILSEGAPARAGADILLAESGEKIGEMTSGAFSPNLKKNVGMGYVDKPYDKVGTELKVVVRGKQNPAKVAKVPFITPTYYKG